MFQRCYIDFCPRCNEVTPHEDHRIGRRIALALLALLAPRVSASQQTPPVDATHLRGTVELHGDTPAERLLKSGSFEISWADGGVGSIDQVTIENGRWEAECHAPKGCQLWLQKIVVNGGPGLLFTQHPPVVPESRTLAWTFDRMPQASLEVVDARTGGSIDEVELWAKQSRGLVATNDQMPNAKEVQVLGATLPNPIRLPFDATSINHEAVGRCYFVRAKGYAWTSIVVDHRVTGSRLVCLEPSGTVQLKPRASGKPLAESDRVWISLWREAGGARLRLTTLALTGSADPPPLESLPAGEILIGTSTKGAMLRIDAAERITRTNVAAGEVTAVELDCGKDLAAQTSPVSVLCELDFPDELMPADGIPQLLLVSTKPLREYSPVPTSLDSRRAPAGRAKLSPWFKEVPPGEYYLSGNFPPVSISVHVGTTIVRVSQRIEACGTLRLRSNDTLGPKVDQLEWFMLGPDGDVSLPMPAVLDKDSSEWIVRAPVGKVQLWATIAKPKAVGRQDLVVEPGETHCQLKILWEFRTKIRLEDRGIPVLLPPAWWESAAVTSAEGVTLDRLRAWQTFVGETAGKGEVFSAHPGDVIQLPVPPGYEPLAPIRVPEGGFAGGVDVKIELVRKVW